MVDAWKKLQTVYEANNKNQILHLQGQLHTMNNQDGDKLESFICCVAELWAALLVLGEILADETLVPICLEGSNCHISNFCAKPECHKSTTLLRATGQYATTRRVFSEDETFTRSTNGKQKMTSGPDFQSSKNFMICGRKGHDLVI